MKLFSLLLLTMLCAAVATAQTSVDRVTRAMDSLSTTSFNDWKISQDLKSFKETGDPTKAGYDDSKWDVLKIRQWVYPDSCWIRKEVVLPEEILGQPLRGPVRFKVTLDDYGYLWINGEAKGRFNWDGDFELTNDAKPGQRFIIAIKAVNTGGPMRLLRAEATTTQSAALQKRIQDMSLSLRVGQKLLSFDTYQTNSTQKTDPGTDKSTTNRDEKKKLNEQLQNLATRLDIDALGKGKVDAFMKSLDAIRPELKPIGDFAKQYTLFFTSNAHIDAAWLWRYLETIAVCHNTFASVFNMMNQRPDFTYTQSAALYYSWMQKLYPQEIFQKIKERVKDGRWEVVGGMWVEPDCNLPAGESWARHLLYAKRYFRDSIGTDVKIGWNPDSFGYNGNMPMFYQSAGIDAFITQKIGWNETNVFPYRVFWWESDDGSRILSYFPFDYVNTIEDPFSLVDWQRQFDANTGFRKLMILFGVGDHGGGPSLEMLDRIDRLKGLDIYPTIEYGTATQYIDWLRKQGLENIPVWKDELYLEYHQGTYTTQAKMKESNRHEEVLLTDAEKFSSIASLYGKNYPADTLANAWKQLMFTQFHDILPGSSIHEVYVDAAETHADVQATANQELHNSLSYIAGRINTSKMTHGTPVVIFNPLAWQRTDIARVALLGDDRHPYAVFDSQGKEIPSQIVTEKHGREILFIANNVPSLGYATYELRPVKAAQQQSAFNATPWSLENDLFRIAIDQSTGWVKSIVDKRNGKELLKGPGNELQLLEDLPKAWDAWNIGWTGTIYPSTFRRAELVENGPVRVVVRLYRDYLKPGVKKEFPTDNFPTSFFEQDIVLYKGLDRIDFVTNVDWWESKTMLKVAFPLAFEDTVATYEIPYGAIERPTGMRTSWEKAKVEVPAQRWADVTAGGYGVSLLNNVKYGYDIKGNVMRLSLLRSPQWPDPLADRGKHTILYALYPHAGTWHEANTVQRGYEYNAPLIPLVNTAHRGTLPTAHSFVNVTSPHLVLSTVKKAEDGNGLVFQCYDASGQGADATITLPANAKQAMLVNFLEDGDKPVAVKGNMMTVPVKKSGVVTIKVNF